MVVGKSAKHFCLRYSLVPRLNPDKYTERWGVNVNGTVDFGRKVSCTVSRNGDLIWKTYLQVDLPTLTGTNCAWTNNIGHALIDYVNIEIGGQEIDRHYGDWFNIWNELTQTAEHEDGLTLAHKSKY